MCWVGLLLHHSFSSLIDWDMPQLDVGARRVIGPDPFNIQTNKSSVTLTLVLVAATPGTQSGLQLIGYGCTYINHPIGRFGRRHEMLYVTSFSCSDFFSYKSGYNFVYMRAEFVFVWVKMCKDTWIWPIINKNGSVYYLGFRDTVADCLYHNFVVTW